jgi:hypothetical protein
VPTPDSVPAEVPASSIVLTEPAPTVLPPSHAADEYRSWIDDQPVRDSGGELHGVDGAAVAPGSNAGPHSGPLHLPTDRSCVLFASPDPRRSAGKIDL